MRIPKIFNFITSHPKFFWRCFVIFYCIFSLLILYFAPRLFASSSPAYYYIMSSIVQGFIALIAFLGSIAIFKIQSIDTIKGKSIHLLEDALRGIGLITIDTVTDAGILRVTKKFIKENEGYPLAKRDKIIIQEYKRYQELCIEKREIEASIKDFASWNFLTVGAALISMPFSPVLSSGLWVYIAATLVLLDMSLAIRSLFIAFYLMRKILRPRMKKHQVLKRANNNLF